MLCGLLRIWGWNGLGGSFGVALSFAGRFEIGFSPRGDRGGCGRASSGRVNILTCAGAFGS